MGEGNESGSGTSRKNSQDFKGIQPFLILPKTKIPNNHFRQGVVKAIYSIYQQ